MCLVSLSKQLSQRKSFLCLVNFEIRMWQSTSLEHAVVSLCPLGSAGLRPLVLSDTLANCWAWRGFQSLPTWDGWELVILLYEAPYPTALSHSVPWLSLHIRIYLFFEYFANGSWRVAGSLQAVSLNTLWDLSLAYFIFSSQREGVYKSKRSGKLLASQELPALLPLLLHLTWWRLLPISSNTEKLHLSVDCGTQVLGFKFPLLVFLRSWADACCASCYSSQPRDKCQSWHEEHVSETENQR